MLCFLYPVSGNLVVDRTDFEVFTQPDVYVGAPPPRLPAFRRVAITRCPARIHLAILMMSLTRYSLSQWQDVQMTSNGSRVALEVQEGYAGQVLAGLTENQAKVLVFISHGAESETGRKRFKALREIAQMIDLLVADRSQRSGMLWSKR